jgi:signal transduction histidine kinase
MGRPYGSRTLLAISGVLVLLLGALGAVQYRWSTRVAAADAQREREHLDSAAALFASDFNTAARQAVSFLQNDARDAMNASRPVNNIPKFLCQIYYLDHPEHGAPEAQRLDSEGRFAPADPPAWSSLSHCAALVLDEPPALVVPLYDVQSATVGNQRSFRLMSSASQQPGRCFAAALDQAYLRDTFIPQLIRRTFGATAASEYDFAVAAGAHVVYGKAGRADLQRPFFSVMPADMGIGKAPVPPAAHGQSLLIVQRVDTIVSKGAGGIAPLFGPGAWNLQVSHKGVPLADAFEQNRRRDLLAGVLVEALLVAAIVFLVLAARRMQQLADQKMQFVAGVSHELRTPVSAIAMLSRNQADGLVSGADRVKQYGELIHQQSRRLNEMVEQTLQYAGIHSGLRTPVRNPVDLRRLIQETVEARRDDLTRGGIALEVALADDLPPIVGDPHWLRTAIDNLLSNAQKHAGEGHWIRVSAVRLPGEKEVRISVEDRGAGIDPTDQAEIFEPFCRGRAAIEAQIPGSGLGLSLVRSAAEVHHGAVTLVSEPGRGSTFTLHLPV